MAKTQQSRIALRKTHSIDPLEGGTREVRKRVYVENKLKGAQTEERPDLLKEFGQPRVGRLIERVAQVGLQRLSWIMRVSPIERQAGWDEKHQKIKPSIQEPRHLKVFSVISKLILFLSVSTGIFPVLSHSA